MAEAEVIKLRRHLELLREEYVKLQARHADLERKYEVALASSENGAGESFVSRLLATVSELFNQKLYSDMTIQLEKRTLHAHRFILAARSEVWSKTTSDQVDLTEFPHEVAFALMQWVYTGTLNSTNDEAFHLSLLKAAKKYKLAALAETCEQALVSWVTFRTCLQYYQAASEVGAVTLQQHCAELVAAHWEDFTSSDFASMPAALAYQMFKSKSSFPLHTAIRTNREDVVFLYLVENDALLPGKLNELNKRGELPLDLALREKYSSIGETLVKYRADVNQTDESGVCLLHRAILRGDEFSASFLINHGCDVTLTSPTHKESALHLVAGKNGEKAVSSAQHSADREAAMTGVARLLLEKGASANVRDAQANSPLHKAILTQNEAVFSVLLAHSDLDLELPNGEGQTPLALALQQEPVNGCYGEESFAARLIKRCCSVDSVNKATGDTLLYKVTRLGNEVAALFLVENGCNANLTNAKGETALHIACYQGHAKLTRTLLSKGASSNSLSLQALREGSSLWKQTPLHLAIEQRHTDVIQVILDFKAEVTKGGDSLLIIPNFTLKDSEDNTPLAVALWNSLPDIALQLVKGGASVNDVNSEGLSLLHQALLKEDSQSAAFLITQGADVNKTTRDGRTPLQLAISCHLPAAVEQLCVKGADMTVREPNTGDCPLWQALDANLHNIASILVKHGCDCNMWGPGAEGCQQTQLHRAIDENNEDSACFLIRSMCDVNSTRRLGPNGEGADLVMDQHTPMHMCCTWGLEKVVQCLIEHNASVNVQDAEGKTPLHIAIENQHPEIITLLLSDPSLDLLTFDRHGVTPFAAAMMTRNNKAAQAILDRAPQSAEQYPKGRNFMHTANLKNDIKSVLFLLSVQDTITVFFNYPKGKNFLHTAILKNDIESVLFLLSVHVDVNSRTRDAEQRTPLQIATVAGHEMICRNLILAGARVNDVTASKKTCLHLAAEHDHSALCAILLENHADYNALDTSLNNALHLACQCGHLNVVRVLLTESQINAEAVNMRGQNPMHVLGQFGKENAAAIFELFLECMPKYLINQPDINGSTVLLLAYFNGNGALCRAVVRAGASLGTANKDGVSIFNAPVATKQLLFKLLDMLNEEPPWTEGDVCQECGVKFSISTRKHHCRHCGRLLCSKCSSKLMPIIKYNISKPTRVCEICFDVLSYGSPPT